MKFTRYRVLVALALALGLGSGNRAGAADWSLVPSVNLKTEYNSNLYLGYQQPSGDFIFTLAPSAEFNYTIDNGRLQGKLGLTGLHYAKYSKIDRIDQNYQINGQYGLTERLGFSMNSSYIADSTIEQELETSGVVMGRSPRESLNLAPGFTYALTERLSATLGYGYGRVDYTDPSYRNYYNHQVSLRLAYLLANQKTTLSGIVVGRETRYPGDDLYRSLGPSLGLSHKFSERWEVNLRGGLNISYLDFGTQVQDYSLFPYYILVKTARQRQTSVSPSLELSATGRWTNTTLTATYSRDESASATGTVTESNRFSLSLKYDFTERLTGGVIVGFYTSQALSEQSSYNTAYYSAGTQLNYKITEKLSAVPGYSFAFYEDKIGGQSAKRHLISFMLTYTYPLHYQR